MCCLKSFLSNYYLFRPDTQLFQETSELDVAFPLRSLPATGCCYEEVLYFHCGNSCISVTNEGIFN